MFAVGDAREAHSALPHHCASSTVPPSFQSVTRCETMFPLAKPATRSAPAPFSTLIRLKLVVAPLCASSHTALVTLQLPPPSATVSQLKQLLSHADNTFLGLSLLYFDANLQEDLANCVEIQKKIENGF